MVNLLMILVISNLPGGTFSIVAMDPETEEWGVAVSSKVLDVGYVVPWLRAGVGGVATQALTNPYYGPWALDELSKGKSAEEALKTVLARDSTPEDRQVGIVDTKGRSAAFTGESTMKWAGHRTAPYVSVQGNILAGASVVDSMMAVFQRTKGSLAERLLSALEAGEKEGGDRRGKQSAALYVVRKRGGYQGVDERLVELKVVDNKEPVKELRREYELWQYAFLAPAYLRLSKEEKGRENVFVERAHSLLQKALGSNIKNADVYNSLAWEFALMKKYTKETLEAARRAHELAPDDANIMDTYAESFFAAGNYKMAVYWESQALKNEPDNKFFQKQIKKFKEALRGQ